MELFCYALAISGGLGLSCGSSVLLGLPATTSLRTIWSADEHVFYNREVDAIYELAVGVYVCNPLKIPK